VALDPVKKSLQDNPAAKSAPEIGVGQNRGLFPALILVLGIRKGTG